jgi:hypothetical protein
MKVYILVLLIVLIGLSFFIKHIEPFENSMAGRSVASKTTNVLENVYASDILLDTPTGSDIEPAICFHLKNRTNDDSSLLSLAGIENTDAVNKICLTKTHFVSLYAIQSLMSFAKLKLTKLYNKAVAVNSWRKGFIPNTPLKDYLDTNYRNIEDVFNKQETLERYQPKTTPDNPYLTTDMGDKLLETTKPANYYLTKDIGDKEFVSKNNYITLPEARKRYESMKEPVLTQSKLTEYINKIKNA